MTNLEKLFQVLGETFPGIKFVESEVKNDLGCCGWLACRNKEGFCDVCEIENFWYDRYTSKDMKPEPDADITTGYVVMVDDEGTEIPYSGCIHPTWKHAEEEIDQAEYHGWITSIRSVKFRFTSKGGGKNA